MHNVSHKKAFIVMSLIALGVVSFWFYENNNTSNVVKVDPVINNYVQQDVRLQTSYISSPDSIWPPVVESTPGSFECTETGNQIKQGGMTSKKIISGKTYCVTLESQGAAGSTYTSYTYKTLINGKIATINFVLRFVQCANYDETQKSECLIERQMFDPDGLANAIIENARL